jgi:uncharacterized membrane protein YphA (DoxX/SURF4 family)
LVDPIGFSYKLQEYAAPDVLNLPFLASMALVFAIFLVVLEIVFGLMLLLGYKTTFTVWSLFALIVFFTFLTFYSAYFNKVTDCGCFGDAIPLTPWQSFTKDVILLILILVLIAGKKQLNSIFTSKISFLINFVAVFVSLWIAYYGLMHLPMVDFRPYKIGANIEQSMIIPAGAPKPLFEYSWRFDVKGEEKIVKTSGNYPQVDGTFVDVETKLIKEGYKPPIHDFSIEKDGNDYTLDFLKKEKVILVVMYNLSKVEQKGAESLSYFISQAEKKSYEIIALSASGAKDVEKFKATYGLDLDFYVCDETALKTIVRSNPGILVLNKGTIVQKRHWNDLEKIKL